MELIRKNTVNAKGQLKKNDYVTFENKEGNGVRVLFVGNSMTRHGILPEIGWYGDYGMAASSKDKDYVHIVMNYIKKDNPDAVCCICQCSEWERQYKQGDTILDEFCNARDFHADIMIVRLIENCPMEEFDQDLFKRQYDKLISYLNPTGKAKIVVTTGFWRHIADEAIREYAIERGYAWVELNDLGDQEEMMALNLFEHEGVAIHPGDKGMLAIATRISERI